jgi:nucleoside-diphosphate-sugar epimerase
MRRSSRRAHICAIPARSSTEADPKFKTKTKAEIQNMRILLAGATGAIGRRVLPLLIAEGHQVTAMVRAAESARRAEEAGATAALADAMDADAVRKAVLAAAPEVVMHQLTSLAGGDFAANAALRIHGSRHLADAAAEVGVRLFVAQSINWMYEPGDAPATEQVPLDVRAAEPRATTVRAVAELERQAARSPQSVVLRYGAFYGLDTWYAPDGSFAEQARTARLAATADVTSFVHVDDAAAAAIAALRWPTGVVNVCDDEPAPGLAWVPAFCAAVGAPVPSVDDDAPPAGTARGADNAYARRTLGWTPRWTSWREGFAAFSR